MNFKDLKEKEFYIIKITERGRNANFPYLAIAQLTRISILENCNYDVYHFKHNKREFLFYDYAKSNNEFSNYSNNTPYYSVEIVEKQSGTEKDFAFHNSRIQLHDLAKDVNGNYLHTYFPKGYTPGSHQGK